MQPYGNSFGGEIVLDSFNIVYRDEGSILDQKYKKKICLNLNDEDFNLNSDLNAYFKKLAHNNKELMKLGVSATVVLV